MTDATEAENAPFPDFRKMPQPWGNAAGIDLAEDENPVLAALDNAGMSELGAFADQGFEDLAGAASLAGEETP